MRVQAHNSNGRCTVPWLLKNTNNHMHANVSCTSYI
uniref:Uncharacterized protein n=1 Tax=Arundo donax TaxID=35708 RepID=A0A0A9HLN1_ARUDO